MYAADTADSAIESPAYKRPNVPPPYAPMNVRAPAAKKDASPLDGTGIPACRSNARASGAILGPRFPLIPLTAGVGVQ
jgi:hypothetical protein